MSALEAFVNEQKRKTGGLGSSIGSASFSSFGDLRNKLSNSISGLPLLSRSDTGDTESLTGESMNGQLPQGKNRKNSGWFSGDESMFGLSYSQRIVAFLFCIIGAVICFSTAVMLIPVIVVSTRKFAALNSLGSVLMLFSFAFLLGPHSFLQNVLSTQRRLCTVCYLSALFATLYSSLWLRSTMFTLFASIFQGVALIWFVLSYIPGGERGIRFMTSFVKRSPTSVLPI